MGNNIKAFNIKNVSEGDSIIEFQYKGFIITINQDDGETNGNLIINVSEYIPESKDYTEVPIASLEVNGRYGRSDWEDTWWDEFTNC
tara:strand:- start:145 stop:405 length:261 start_codon:yes stop_codon:yes gene_type:complete